MASSQFNSFLLQAAKRGDLYQVRALLDRGAEADALDRDGTTPLMFVALNGATEILRLLLAAGADCNRSRKLYG